VESCGGGDPLRVREVKARFSKPVLPGNTIVTEMWREEGEKVVFQSRVSETGELCLSGGWVRFGNPVDSKL